MSIGYSRGKTSQPKCLIGAPGEDAAKAWTRHPAWLSMGTALTGSDNKFVGLHAVYQKANFVALSAAGNFTVDWGDGSAAENVNSGVTAYHEYDYSDSDLANTNGPVTFTDSGDLVNRTSHGFNNGDRVQFFNIVSTTGLVEGYEYFVVNKNTNDFQVSKTIGGSAVTLTTDGSGALLQYKQALVTVTMQSGQTFTGLNLHLKHNQTGLQAYETGWLDIAVAGASLTDLRLGVPNAGSQTPTVGIGRLERFNLVASAVRSASGLFYQAFSLRNIPSLALNSTAFASLSCTTQDAGNTFTYNGHGLVDGDSVVLESLTTTTGLATYTKYFVVGASANTFQLSTTVGGAAGGLVNDGSASVAVGVATDYMFKNAYSIDAIPTIDTTTIIWARSMFESCRALSTLPHTYTLSHCYSLTNFFLNCNALREAPIDKPLVARYLDGMFWQCWRLRVAPVMDTSLATTMANMFSTCVELEEVPVYDGTNCTTFFYMFNTCRSLRRFPGLINCNVSHTLQGLLAGCQSLVEVEKWSTSNCTSFSNTFNNCTSLQNAPDLSYASATNIDAIFANCASLLKFPPFTGLTGNISAYQFAMSCQSIVVGPTFPSSVNITNASQMFNYCYALREVIPFSTTGCADFPDMFRECHSLKSVPWFDTSSATNMNYMFNNCYSLLSVPTFPITGQAINMGFILANCRSLDTIPAWNLASLTSTITSGFTPLRSLSRILVTGHRYSVNVSGGKLSKEALETFFDNLGNANAFTNNTATISSNYGAPAATSVTSCTTAAGSKVVTTTSTGSVTVGNNVYGTGLAITTGAAVTFTDAGDLVNLTGHGLSNGDRVFFSVITTTTGISICTPYYVVNANANDFQVSDTAGGGAKTLTTNGSGTCRWVSKIVSINPNVSFTMDTPAVAAGTVTLSNRALDIGKAQIKGWAISG